MARLGPSSPLGLRYESEHWHLLCPSSSGNERLELLYLGCIKWPRTLISEDVLGGLQAWTGLPGMNRSTGARMRQDPELRPRLVKMRRDQGAEDPALKEACDRWKSNEMGQDSLS